VAATTCALLLAASLAWVPQLHPHAGHARTSAPARTGQRALRLRSSMAAAAVNTNPFCLTRPQVVLFGDRCGARGRLSACSAVARPLLCLHSPLVMRITRAPHSFCCSLTQHAFDPDGGWGSALAHHLQRKVCARLCACGACVA
jgi:hypothetical protein